MKEDAPVPEQVPVKRRQLESAPDRWLAVWLARDDLSPSQRRRVSDEKARRRAARPSVRVGLVVSAEGMTPPQFVTVAELIDQAGATEVVHTRLPRKHHGAVAGACRSLGIPLRLVEDARDDEAAAKAIVRDVDRVIAAPREARPRTHATPGVWSAIGLARHRGLAVQVVLPDGTTGGGK
jgi:hypothetical protein